MIVKSMNDKTIFFKNSLLVAFSTVFGNLIFFVINIMIARYFDIAHFGEYTTAIGYATLFSLIADIGIKQTLIRFVNLEPENEREHLGNSFVIKTVLMIVIYALMAISLYFTNYNYETIKLALLFGVVRIIEEYLKFFHSLFDAKQKYLIPSLYNILYYILCLIVTILIVVAGGNYYQMALTRILAVLFIAILVALVIYQTFRFKFNYKIAKRFLIETIPFGLYAFCFTIIQKSNLVFLSLIHGTILTGFFNNAHMFFLTLFFIPTVFNRILVPYLYKHLESGSRDKFQFAFDVFSKFLSVIGFYVALIFFAYSTEIIVMVFGIKYLDSGIILKIIALGMPFIFSITNTLIMCLDKQRQNTKIVGIGVLVNIIGGITLIYFYNVNGAAIANFITFAVIFTLSHLYLTIYENVKIKKTIIIYIILTLICFVTYFVKVLTADKFHFIISIFIMSVVYFTFVLLALVRKSDIRIIKETLGIMPKKTV